MNGKVIGLYFSAAWCPPCRAFTPKLVEFRNANQSEFEVVFISSDRAEKDQADYMKKYNMEWLAVPHATPNRTALGKKFGIRGIPSRIILDDKGNLISRDGRSDVTGADALKNWKAKVKPAA